jgi:hypothetical protein
MLDDPIRQGNPEPDPPPLTIETGRKRPPIIKRQITLKDEDKYYDGWTFTARLNPPVGAIAAITSGMPDRIIFGLREVVTEWDFIDEEGEPLTCPGDMHMLQPDLMAALIQAWNKAAEVPKLTKS